MFEVSDAEHFDGLSGFVKDLDIPVVAVYEGQDLVRKRFALAHELGHLLLDFSKAVPKDTEKLCHAFAGALLLPEFVIKKELGEKRTKITQWEFKKLKGIYGISIQAIMARAHNLEIIPDHFYRSFCIYARKNGWYKQEPGEYKGEGFFCGMIVLVNDANMLMFRHKGPFCKGSLLSVPVQGI